LPSIWLKLVIGVGGDDGEVAQPPIRAEARSIRKMKSTVRGLFIARTSSRQVPITDSAK
jgi:hypothetical protein